MLYSAVLDNVVPYHKIHLTNHHPQPFTLILILTLTHPHPRSLSLSAVLYIWMWSEIRSVWDLYILPDWLNIFGSFLYWLSASQYNDQQPRSLLNIRRIELFASCVEVLATAGWCGQWYAEYFTDLATIPLSCVGRGFTLDDPGITKKHTSSSLSSSLSAPSSSSVTILHSLPHYHSYSHFPCTSSSSPSFLSLSC